MVIRSALGAFAAVATLGAVALALPEHKAANSTAVAGTPFGSVAKVATPPADETTAAALTGQTKLIETAALTDDSRTAASPAIADAPVAAVPLPTTNEPEQVGAASAASVAPTDPAPQAASAVDQPVPASNTPARVVALASPITEPDPKPQAAVAPKSRPGSSLIDINTASAEALDRAGAGRIGRTIVSHRPYRSVQDLLNKRVLRTKDFERIQASIKAD